MSDYIIITARPRDNQAGLRKRLAELTLPEPRDIQSELQRVAVQRLAAESVPQRRRFDRFRRQTV